MLIKINDIPPEGLTVDVEDVIALLNDGKTTASAKATITIKPAGRGMFHITGKVSAAAELECSRCLKNFPFNVENASMEFDLVPEGLLEASAEYELVGSELDTEFYRGDEIEPIEFIREQILLSIPMVPLHSEDCKGLCQVCGADLNDRPCSHKIEKMPERENPFSVLKKIIKREKE